MTPPPIVEVADGAEALACLVARLSPRAFPACLNVLAFAFPAARPRSEFTNSSGPRIWARRSIGKRFIFLAIT